MILHFCLIVTQSKQDNVGSEEPGVGPSFITRICFYNKNTPTNVFCAIQKPQHTFVMKRAWFNSTASHWTHNAPSRLHRGLLCATPEQRPCTSWTSSVPLWKRRTFLSWHWKSMRSAIGSITPTNKPFIPSAHRQGPACWWASWGPADQANPPCSTCWQALSLQPLEKSPSTAFRFQMKPRDRGSDWSHKKTICCLNSRLAKTFIMPPDWRFQG